MVPLHYWYGHRGKTVNSKTVSFTKVDCLGPWEWMKETCTSMKWHMGSSEKERMGKKIKQKIKQIPWLFGVISLYGPAPSIKMNHWTHTLSNQKCFLRHQGFDT